MLTNYNSQKEEIEPYLELKQDKLFDVAYDILNYCRDHSPLLLKYGNTFDIVEILGNHIEFTNPFVRVEDDDIDEDDEYDEM